MKNAQKNQPNPAEVVNIHNLVEELMRINTELTVMEQTVIGTQMLFTPGTYEPLTLLEHKAD